MPNYHVVFETEEPIETPLGETDHIAISGVDPINIEPRHSAIGLWSVDTAGVTDEQAQAIEQFARAKARTKIYVSDDHYDYDDLALTPGPLHNTQYQEETGELDLEGEDGAYYLMAGSTDVEYVNESVPNALRDYWNRIEGFDAQVDDPEPRILAEGVVIQSPIDEESFIDLFQAAMEPDEDDDDDDGLEDLDADTIPINVTDDGIEFLHTCEVADMDGDDEDESYSGGEAEAANMLESFSFDYTIPEEHVGIALREGIHDDPTEVSYSWQGETLLQWEPGGNDEPNWFQIDTFYDEGDLESGSLVVQEEDDGGDDDYHIDVIAVFDRRFHDDDDFDNEVHEDNGFLDSPRLYGQIDLVTEDTDAGNAIVKATLDIEINSTGGEQRIQVSFDGGETWLPDDGSEDNTDSITVENEDVATVEMQGRIRLSGHSPDGPQDATPRFGYAGQTIESWELDVDLSSLGVIEDDRFDDDHLSNLQEIHSRGDYRFTLIPTDNGDGDIPVRSYQRGTWEIPDVSWKAVSRSRNLTTEEYWNVVTVKGPRDDDTGERPVTTREDDDEIERVGEELEQTIIRNDLDSEADRATVATQELLEAIDAVDVSGEIEAAPTLILPGPRYYVEAWDAWVDLEGLRYADQYGGGNANLIFDNRAVLVDRLDQTQGDLSHEKR